MANTRGHIFGSLGAFLMTLACLAVPLSARWYYHDGPFHEARATGGPETTGYVSEADGYGHETTDRAPEATDHGPEATDHGPEATGRLAVDGTCVCTLEVPAVVICTDYQTRINSQNLRDIQRQISNLTLDVNKLLKVTNWHSQLFAAFETNLTEVTSTFDLLEGGQVLVTRVEIEGLRSRIQNMESLLYALREWNGLEPHEARVRRIQVMLNEASNISRVVDAMVGQDTFEDLAAMQRDILVLTDQLEACKSQETESAPPEAATAFPAPATASPLVHPVVTASPLADEGGPDETETLPEMWPVKEKQNSCGRLVSISEPYTVRGNLATNGTWMRDPILNPDFVYFHRFPDLTSYRERVDDPPFKSGASIKSFQRNQTHEVTGEAMDPTIVESVVYNGSLFAYTYTYSKHRNFYSRQKLSTDLSKIQLSTKSTAFPPYSAANESTKRALTPSQLELSPYLPPVSVPPVDLTVDETGPWLLYGDSAGMLTVTELDQDTLSFKRTLHGSYPKSRLANCFVICARVYCLNSYTRFDSRLSFYLDTATGFEGFANVPFMVKYGKLSSIEYNPRDQLLYGWDNGHAVVYSLMFE